MARRKVVDLDKVRDLFVKFANLPDSGELLRCMRVVVGNPLRSEIDGLTEAEREHFEWLCDRMIAGAPVASAITVEPQPKRKGRPPGKRTPRNPNAPPWEEPAS